MNDETRREFLKKTAYVAPVMLTLAATPSIARSGSGDGEGPPVLREKPHTMRPKEDA